MAATALPPTQCEFIWKGPKAAATKATELRFDVEFLTTLSYASLTNAIRTQMGLAQSGDTLLLTDSHTGAKVARDVIPQCAIGVPQSGQVYVFGSPNDKFGATSIPIKHPVDPKALDGGEYEREEKEIGSEFETSVFALAELIDGAIQATSKANQCKKQKIIQIILGQDTRDKKAANGPKSDQHWVVVGDNGVGMSPHDIADFASFSKTPDQRSIVQDMSGNNKLLGYADGFISQYGVGSTQAALYLAGGVTVLTRQSVKPVARYEFILDKELLRERADGQTKQAYEGNILVNEDGTLPGSYFVRDKYSHKMLDVSYPGKGVHAVHHRSKFLPWLYKHIELQGATHMEEPGTLRKREEQQKNGTEMKNDTSSSSSDSAPLLQGTWMVLNATGFHAPADMSSRPKYEDPIDKKARSLFNNADKLPKMLSLMYHAYLHGNYGRDPYNFVKKIWQQKDVPPNPADIAAFVRHFEATTPSRHEIVIRRVVNGVVVRSDWVSDCTTDLITQAMANCSSVIPWRINIKKKILTTVPGTDEPTIEATTFFFPQLSGVQQSPLLHANGEVIASSAPSKKKKKVIEAKAVLSDGDESDGTTEKTMTEEKEEKDDGDDDEGDNDGAASSTDSKNAEPKEDREEDLAMYRRILGLPILPSTNESDVPPILCHWHGRLLPRLKVHLSDLFTVCMKRAKLTMQQTITIFKLCRGVGLSTQNKIKMSLNMKEDWLEVPRLHLVFGSTSSFGAARGDFDKIFKQWLHHVVKDNKEVVWSEDHRMDAPHDIQGTAYSEMGLYVYDRKLKSVIERKYNVGRVIQLGTTPGKHKWGEVICFVKGGTADHEHDSVYYYRLPREQYRQLDQPFHPVDKQCLIESTSVSSIIRLPIDELKALYDKYYAKRQPYFIQRLAVDFVDPSTAWIKDQHRVCSTGTLFPKVVVRAYDAKGNAVIKVNNIQVRFLRVLEEKINGRWRACENLDDRLPVWAEARSSTTTAAAIGEAKEKKTRKKRAPAIGIKKKHTTQQGHLKEMKAPRPGEFRMRFTLDNYPLDVSQEVLFPFRATVGPPATMKLSIPNAKANNATLGVRLGEENRLIVSFEDDEGRAVTPKNYPDLKQHPYPTPDVKITDDRFEVPTTTIRLAPAADQKDEFHLFFTVAPRNATSSSSTIAEFQQCQAVSTAVTVRHPDSASVRIQVLPGYPQVCHMVSPSECYNNVTMPSLTVRLRDQFGIPTWTDRPSGRFPAKIQFTCATPRDGKTSSPASLIRECEFKKDHAVIQGLIINAPSELFTHAPSVDLHVSAEALQDNGKRLTGVGITSQTIRLLPGRYPTSICFNKPPHIVQAASTANDPLFAGSVSSLIVSLRSPAAAHHRASSPGSQPGSLDDARNGNIINGVEEVHALPTQSISFSVSLRNEVNAALLLRSAADSKSPSSSSTSRMADGVLSLTMESCGIMDRVLWSSKHVDSPTPTDDDDEDATDTEDDEPAPPVYSALRTTRGAGTTTPNKANTTSTTTSRKRNASRAELTTPSSSLGNGRNTSGHGSDRRVRARMDNGDHDDIKSTSTVDVKIEDTQLHVTCRMPEHPHQFGRQRCVLRTKRCSLEFDLIIEYGMMHSWALRVDTTGPPLAVNEPWGERFTLCRRDQFNNILPLSHWLPRVEASKMKFRFDVSGASTAGESTHRPCTGLASTHICFDRQSLVAKLPRSYRTSVEVTVWHETFSGEDHTSCLLVAGAMHQIVLMEHRSPPPPLHTAIKVHDEVVFGDASPAAEAKTPRTPALPQDEDDSQLQESIHGDIMFTLQERHYIKLEVRALDQSQNLSTSQNGQVMVRMEGPDGKEVANSMVYNMANPERPSHPCVVNLVNGIAIIDALIMAPTGLANLHLVARVGDKMHGVQCQVNPLAGCVIGVGAQYPAAPIVAGSEPSDILVTPTLTGGFTPAEVAMISSGFEVTALGRDGIKWQSSSLHQGAFRIRPMDGSSEYTAGVHRYLVQYNEVRPQYKRLRLPHEPEITATFDINVTPGPPSCLQLMNGLGPSTIRVQNTGNERRIGTLEFRVEDQYNNPVPYPLTEAKTQVHLCDSSNRHPVSLMNQPLSLAHPVLSGTIEIGNSSATTILTIKDLCVVEKSGLEIKAITEYQLRVSLNDLSFIKKLIFINGRNFYEQKSHLEESIEKKKQELVTLQLLVTNQRAREEKYGQCRDAVYKLVRDMDIKTEGVAALAEIKREMDEIKAAETSIENYITPRPSPTANRTIGAVNETKGFLSMLIHDIRCDASIGDAAIINHYYHTKLDQAFISSDQRSDAFNILTVRGCEFMMDIGSVRTPSHDSSYTAGNPVLIYNTLCLHNGEPLVNKPKIQRAVCKLIGGAVIVDTLPHAVAYLKSFPSCPRVLTRDGRKAYNNGQMDSRVDVIKPLAQQPPDRSIIGLRMSATMRRRQRQLAIGVVALNRALDQQRMLDGEFKAHRREADISEKRIETINNELKGDHNELIKIEKKIKELSRSVSSPVPAASSSAPIAAAPAAATALPSSVNDGRRTTRSSAAAAMEESSTKRARTTKD